MATVADTTPARRHPLAPDMFERLLAVAAIVLLGFVAVAMARGYPTWGRVPAIIWAHLATITVALALTPYMLLRPRGDRRHRQIGTVWMVAMIGTAAMSLFIRNRSPTGFSIIHILSVITIVMVRGRGGPRAPTASRRTAGRSA